MERNIAEPAPLMLNRAEYHAWTQAQPRGRTERIMGEVIRLSAERVRHVRIKARVWRALDDAIRAAGLPCEALSDGVTIEVGDDTDYEPDALVNCGERLDGDELVAPNPVIVVEVSSRSTQSVDTGLKLTDYFRVPSIQHYLIVRADQHVVIHHRRTDTMIATQIITAGPITLDPPGVTIAMEHFYIV